MRDGDGFTCVGILHVGEHDIRCSNRYGHGYLTTDQALMKSCNAALMTMGMRIGVDDFRKYMTIFNIGNRTGIDLPGEAARSGAGCGRHDHHRPGGQLLRTGL